MHVYHLLTKSEVITGKSQTEGLMCRKSDSEGRGLRFPCNDQMDEVNKSFIIWPFLVPLLKRIPIKSTGSNFQHLLGRAKGFRRLY